MACTVCGDETLSDKALAAQRCEFGDEILAHPLDHALWRDAPSADATMTYDAMGEGVTFLLAPLDAETEITGPIAARLFASSSTRDADFFVILRVYTPDLHAASLARSACAAATTNLRNLPARGCRISRMSCWAADRSCATIRATGPRQFSVARPRCTLARSGRLYCCRG